MRTFTKYTKDTLYFKGWNDLIIWYFNGIQKYINDNNIVGFKITGMKEKYGGLRIEQQGADEILFDLCINLENDSEKTCFICGGKGKIRYDLFWFQCLCWNHYIIRKIRNIYKKIINKLCRYDFLKI